MADDQKLTEFLPTRYTRAMRSQLNAYATRAAMSEGEVVRIAVSRFLRRKQTTFARRSAQLQGTNQNGRTQTANAL